MSEIISKLVQIETNLPVDNDFIEQKLLEMGIEPLRWAIVGVEQNEIKELDPEASSGQAPELTDKFHRSLKINKTILTISLACENL